MKITLSSAPLGGLVPRSRKSRFHTAPTITRARTSVACELHWIGFELPRPAIGPIASCGLGASSSRAANDVQCAQLVALEAAAPGKSGGQKDIARSQSLNLCKFSIDSVS